MEIQRLVNRDEIRETAKSMTVGDSVVLPKDDATWLVYEIKLLGFNAMKYVVSKNKSKVWKAERLSDERSSAGSGRWKRDQARAAALTEWDLAVQSKANEMAKPFARGNHIGVSVGINELCGAVEPHPRGLGCQLNRVGRSMRRLPGWVRIQVFLSDGTRQWIYFKRGVDR